MSNDKDMSVRNADREELVFYSKGRMTLLRTQLVPLRRSIGYGATHKFSKSDSCDFFASETLG